VIDGDFEIPDDRFADCIKPDRQGREALRGLPLGGRGPAWFPPRRYLVWSDIPNDRILRWRRGNGHGRRLPPAVRFNTNGHTVDRQGRPDLVLARRPGALARTEHDWSIVVVAGQFEDRAVQTARTTRSSRGDGSIWFTDPAYGIDSDYEGHKAESEIGACHVYRVDPGTGAIRIVAADFQRPNGLAFSPDERRLYISDTARSKEPGGPPHMRVFDVGDDGTLSGGAVFAVPTSGAFDGFRVDDAGRVWTSAGDGVHCYDPDGTLLGKVRIPEKVANVVFGGPKRNCLFICATTSLYSVLLPVNGAKTF
jgi:gluconolactonase